MVALAPGQSVGRYEILRLLGEGGMGWVYEAALVGPAGFRKPVALKVLKVSGDGLAREARLGGLLRHPNLVDVYALEEVDGTWLCAMELVRDGSVAEYLPLEPAAVVDVALQACAGLAHAHAEIGLVHLDLKPENLLLDGARVKVADLGIARARGFNGDRVVRGTGLYIAPEHTAGQQVDARADVFGMGVMLVALATGAPSRAADSVPWLSQVLARCLATDPNDRFPSMGALADALAKLDVGGRDLAETVRATAPTAGPRSSSQETFIFDGVAGTASTNLPDEPDQFIGRRRAIAAVAGLLAEPGLVTVKGPGGMGKTRVALQAARAWHLQEQADVWLCDLQSCRTPRDLLAAVSKALDIPLARGDDAALIEQLGHALEGRGQCLIVLDNFEQIADCGPILESWRTAAPQSRILVTSRELLGLRSEQVIELDPMTIEDGIALLCARAPQLSPADPHLEELAVRLDLLPLALELAAARLRIFPAARVLALLDQRLKLLAGRGSGRQATLRATLDGSWDLLDDDTRRALAWLAVFRGGFTLEAAEAVADPGQDAWVSDLVEALLDRSLLTARRVGDTPRFKMLESVRAYALEKLEPSERLAAERQHGAWYAIMGTEAAIDAMDRFGGNTLLRKIEAERENLLAAAERAIDREDGPTAVCCLRAAWEVVEMRGPVAAVADLSLRVLALDLTDADFGTAALVQARVLRLAGSIPARLEHLHTALQRVRALDGRVQEGRLTAQLASVLLHHGDPTGSEQNWERALQIYRDTHNEIGACDGLLSMGVMFVHTGRLEESARCATQALELCRKIGNRRTEGIALCNLAICRARMGRMDEAAPLYRKALSVHRELGDQRFEALVLGNLAALHADQGKTADARAAMEAALRIHVAIGARAQQGLTLGNLASVLFWQGDVSGARETFHQAAALLIESGEWQTWAVSRMYLGHLEFLEGRDELAVPLLTEARDKLIEVGDPTWAAIASGYLGQVALDSGRFDHAEQLLQGAVDALANRMMQAHLMFRASLAETLAQTGRIERARAMILEAQDELRDLGYARELVEAIATEVRIDVMASDLKAARAALARARTQAALGEDMGPAVERNIRRAAAVLDTL